MMRMIQRRAAMKGDELKTLGELRHESGKTFRKIAELVDVSASTIHRWIKKNVVPAKHRQAFADAIGVDVELIEKISKASLQGRPVRSRDDAAEWMDHVSTSNLHPFARVALAALPSLADRRNWIASITLDELIAHAKLEDVRGDIERLWPDIVQSPFVERLSSRAVEERGAWTLQLRFPE